MKIIIFVTLLLSCILVQAQEYEIDIPFDHYRLLGSSRELHVYPKELPSRKITSPWIEKLYEYFPDYKLLKIQSEFNHQFYEYSKSEKKRFYTKLLSKNLQDTLSFEGRIKIINDSLFSVERFFNSDEEWYDLVYDESEEVLITYSDKPGKIFSKYTLCDRTGAWHFPLIFDQIKQQQNQLIGRVENNYYLLDPIEKTYRPILFDQEIADVTLNSNGAILSFQKEGQLYVFDEQLNLLFKDVIKREDYQLDFSGNNIRKKYLQKKGVRAIHKYALLNAKGKTLVDDLDKLGWNNHGYFWAAKVRDTSDLKYGIISADGAVIVDFKYQSIRDVNNGLFEFKTLKGKDHGAYGVFDSAFNERYFGTRRYNAIQWNILKYKGKMYEIPSLREIPFPEDYEVNEYCGFGVFSARSKETKKCGTLRLKGFRN